MLCKRRFVCAHIGQKRDNYPPSIYGVHFDSYPLPLLRRLTVGAAIEKNFFHFYFSYFRSQSLRSWIEIIYLNFTLVILISKFFFYFFWFSFWLSNINYRFDSLQVLFDIYSFDFRYIFLVSISTCFSIADSTLWLFNSLSLWLLCLL